MGASGGEAVGLGVGDEEALGLLQVADEIWERGQGRKGDSERIDLFIHNEAQLDVGPEPGAGGVTVHGKFFGVGFLELAVELVDQGVGQGLQEPFLGGVVVEQAPLADACLLGDSVEGQGGAVGAENTPGSDEERGASQFGMFGPGHLITLHTV